MKLTELAVVEVDLSKYIDLIEKTEEQCLKTINNSPKVFVLTLIRNSTELQELGDTNEWENDLDVWKHVEDNYLKKDKTGGIDTKDLFKIVYTTLSEKYVKPKEPTKTTTNKAVSGSNKPKELTFDLNEGLMGEEIQYDKKTILSKSEFEAKIKEENGENKEYQFEYTLNQVKVLIKPLSKETKEEKVKKTKETKETKENTNVYYVDQLEKDDDDDEDQFIIITPEKTELPKDENDEESEPLTFDTEEEAEQLVKELNKSLLEKLNGDSKPKKEKKKKEPKVKKETETETKEEVKEDVKVEKEKKEEVKEVTVEADDEDDFDW